MEQKSRGLISMSHDEGFNIPVHDSLFLNKPVLVSDIRHHHEIKDNSLVHFLSNDPDQEVKSISEFLKAVNEKSEEISSGSIVELTRIALEEFKQKVFKIEI